MGTSKFQSARDHNERGMEGCAQAALLENITDQHRSARCSHQPLGFDQYRWYRYLKRAIPPQYQPHTELYMKSISGAEATGRGRGNCLNRFPTKPGQSGWGAEDISCSQPIQCLRLSHLGGKASLHAIAHVRKYIVWIWSYNVQ